MITRVIWKTEKNRLVWSKLPKLIKILLGWLGAGIVLFIIWQTVLVPIRWPELSLVGRYFWQSLYSVDTYKALMATGLRAALGMVIGYTAAVILAVLTGRTVWGWIAFFFLLLVLQKIPAIAMVHVLVSSKLGIGFGMTITLASTVVLTFTWLVLHHRAETLDPREVFSLRVVGFRGWQLSLYGLMPHLGSAIGGSARLAMSISIIMVVLGEWQGIWSDGSIWQYGLGVMISRHYESIHSEARVLSSCLWLGFLGVIMDYLVQSVLKVMRRLTGVVLNR